MQAVTTARTAAALRDASRRLWVLAECEGPLRRPLRGVPVLAARAAPTARVSETARAATRVRRSPPSRAVPLRFALRLWHDMPVHPFADIWRPRGPMSPLSASHGQPWNTGLLPGRSGRGRAPGAPSVGNRPSVLVSAVCRPARDGRRLTSRLLSLQAACRGTFWACPHRVGASPRSETGGKPVALRAATF
jgi:hypothetical protein